MLSVGLSFATSLYLSSQCTLKRSLFILTILLIMMQYNFYFSKFCCCCLYCQPKIKQNKTGMYIVYIFPLSLSLSVLHSEKSRLWCLNALDTSVCGYLFYRMLFCKTGITVLNSLFVVFSASASSSSYSSSSFFFFFLLLLLKASIITRPTKIFPEVNVVVIVVVCCHFSK